MPTMKIRGNTQIMDQTLDVGRLEQDFLNGNDLDITNGNKNALITGITLLPVEDSDVASKWYVDSVAQGLQIHESANLATIANLVALYDNVAAGVGATLTNTDTQAALTIDGVATSTGMRILVKDQIQQIVDVTFDSATPADYNTDFVTIYDGSDTAVHFWFDTTGGDGTPGGATNPVQVDISGQSTSTGIALIFEAAVNAYTDGGDTEFIAYIDGTDASKVVITNTQSGDVTDAATTDATYAAVSTSLTTTGTGAMANGIYTVTDIGSGSSNWVLTRVEDFDHSPANEIHDGDFFFVDSGTANGSNGYVQTNDSWPSPGIVGETNIAWSQFSGAGQIIAGDGIDKVGNTISVDVTDLLGEGLTESSNNFDIDWGGNGSATTVARSDHNHDADYSDISHNHDSDYSDINHDHDSDYSDINHDHDSDYAAAAFTTINTPSGTDPVADSITDTLNLATGGPISITGDSGTDTITFDIGANGIKEEHISWGGTGETNIDAADMPLDTSTGTYAGSATNVQDALEEIESNVTSNYTFRTMNVPNGTNPVAESSGDTLNYTSDNATITITGDETTDTIDFDLTTDGIKDTHIDWGTSTGQVSGGDIPLADSGNYFTTDDVESALQELAATTPGIGYTEVWEEAPSITHNNPVVTIANAPTAGTLRVYLNGQRQREGASYDYTVSGTTLTFTFNLLSTPGQADQVLIDYQY